MLKIKDTFDLKELEKFGWNYHKEKLCEYYYMGYTYWGANITIGEDRKIEFNDEWWGDDFDIMDNLYDLIQAGLVEKVEE